MDILVNDDDDINLVVCGVCRYFNQHTHTHSQYLQISHDDDDDDDDEAYRSSFLLFIFIIDRLID